MSHPCLIGRRVLVIGEGLAETAAAALIQSQLDFGGPERMLDPSGGDPELVLIEAGCAPPAILSMAIEALGKRRSPPAAILMGENLPTGAVRALLRLERSDVLEAPFTSDDLARVAAELMSLTAAPAPAPVPRARSICWTIMGAVGGAGATTVAIELSSAMSRVRNNNSRVCLVDLNLTDGQAPAYLGATPNMQLSQAAAALDRIDPSLLEVYASPISERFHLLAAPRDPRAYQNVSPDTLLRILDVACQVYDWVVIDMPRTRQPWSLDILGGSDELMIISELTVPALLSARSLADELERDMIEGPKPRIVLNRIASRMFGPAPSMVEAERALGRKADGSVTSDWEAAAASVNLGGPISQHRPKSKIVRDIETLAQTLAAAQPRFQERAA